MSDPIDRDGLRKEFWTQPLTDLTEKEWEALCDGCGKCCLNKLEDEETAQVVFTRVACKLLDDSTCRCANYEIRKQFVPECVVLTPDNISKIAYWMPTTCAYRMLYEGKPLHDWHPLITGTAQSVHDAGESVQGWTVSEDDVPVDDWEEHIVGDL